MSIIVAMQCRGCSFEAPAEFSFCPKCGSKLDAACPSCGAPCQSGFSFCPRCGKALPAASTNEAASAKGSVAPGAAPSDTAPPAAAPQPVAVSAEADRRLATVLFADLSGFTSLSERLDPEDVRALQTDLFDAMRTVLERHDAFIEKFIGDAVVAVFGAPVAHEDDPERALRAALEMHACVDALNARWRKRLGQSLELHIGVNTGRVVAGHMGTKAGAAYAVTGDAVNVAARLQAAAGPAQTLVSRNTYTLTQYTFDFEPAGAISLKGKSAPIAAFRLLGSGSGEQTGRGLETHGLQAPLVGREDELAQMLDAFVRVQGGRAQVLSVVGDAGIGKTRLVDEFLERLDADANATEITVRRTTCTSHTAQPYRVLATFIREGYGILPDDPLEVARKKIENGMRQLGAAAEEIASVAPLLGYVLGMHTLEELREIEPERLNRQILQMLRTVLDRRLSKGPLVLVVEDLQWADAASVEGLRLVADWLHNRRLLLLFTYRPAFDARTLETGRATHTTFRLSPLSSAEIDSILSSFFGAAAQACFSASLHEQVVRQAGGNPFYLEEMVRGLIADGVLVKEQGAWTCRAADTVIEVPATLEGLLLSRVDRLPAAAKRCLQEAAVLGPVFDLELLRAVAGEVCGPTLITSLCADELLEPAEPTSAETPEERRRDQRYRFTHSIVRDVVYQNLLLRRRTDLHGRAGRALEQIHAGRAAPLDALEALGLHFSQSDDPVKGARYLVAAGDWARGVYANDDAVRLYERALHTLRACEACERSEVLDVCERLGDLLGPIGRRAEALAHYEAVRSAAKTQSDAVREARLLRKLAGLHWDAGERERSLGCLRDGLSLLEGREDELELAHLYQEMGRLAFRSGDNAGAVAWAERALGQAERAAARPGAGADEHRENHAAIAHALNTLGAALARLGKPEDAVTHIERSVSVAQEAGLLQAACRSYANLGVLYATLDPGRAVDTCLTGLESAKKIGDLGFQSRLYANLAVAYCALTNQCDVEGLRAAQAAIDLDRQLGQIDHLAVPLIVLGQIYQCHGDPNAALRYYEEAQQLAEESGEPQLLFPCYDGLATLYLDAGEPAKAESYLIKADEVCERAGLDRDALVVLPFLC